ncbi:hypothetical protein cypCar_00047452 [Cyprinus carpio]|nr:hypothetical protein cypCar_00047452 [Cyprinus carpio]
MPLPDYPIPELDVTLQEASRVLQLTLNPDQYQRYETALLQQKDALQEVQEQLKKCVSGRENWVTEEFKKQLLSCYDPLPNSTAVPSVLPSSKLKGEFAQIERATALLWAAAKLYSEPRLVEGDIPTERTQQSQVFAASRLPGKSQDELKLSLRQTLGDAATSLIMVTPTHMRHFKHGRCDSTYSTTHKTLIKATKLGHGVEPHLAALRKSMSQDNPLKKFLVPFGCPSIYLTGSDLMEGVECAVGEAVIETNAGVMFVGSMVNGIPRTEVLRPMKEFSNVIWETNELVAHLQPNPLTPGATILTRKNINGPRSIFQLVLSDYVAMMQGARTVANLLCEKLGVHRCALVSMPEFDKPAYIKVLPLHGLEPNVKPQVAEEMEFNPYDPGYCSSKSGPRCEDIHLDQVQAKIRSQLPTPIAPSCFDFHGDPSDGGLFPRIIRGEEQQWRVWEDKEHVAFLTPFPNTPGFTVLVPREPPTSDIFRLNKSNYTALIVATRKVAHLLQKGMNAHGVALIFEGFEIDYAHAKLIPLVPQPNAIKPPAVASQFCPTYAGYVTSADGPPASKEDLTEIHTKIAKTTPPQSWKDPQTHAESAIRSKWYHNLFQIQNTLFHSTVEYFNNKCKYAYTLTPITTDSISSPMGLGSNSEPVFVNMLGQDVYLADSMQFVLEYFMRFHEDLPGAYYVSPSFRGEDPDATHLNQFYHVECELLGDMNVAISIAEGYVAHLTQAMLKQHSSIILNTAGTVSHAQELLKNLEKPLSRVTLDQAIHIMPSSDCLEWVQEGQPQFGRKLTGKGERVLIEKYGGAVWLTEMDHLGVPFYQAYVEGSGRSKAKAAYLLLGLGETLGLGERHSTSEMVREALQHHAVPEDSYKWYINMRQVIPLLTSGWGMGTERYLCWLLQHNDVRDMQIIPRMKAKKFMP